MIASHHNLNMHIRETHREVYIQKRTAQPPSITRNDGFLKTGRLLLCTLPSCFVFVSIYFPGKVPLHNIIYGRKLYINWLLKLSERKTGNRYVSQSSARKFWLPPVPQKGVYTACGKLFSRKLNLSNTFILLVYFPVTFLPMITKHSEKQRNKSSWKKDMYLLYVIAHRYPARDKPKPSCFKNCSFVFFINVACRDSQACQTFLTPWHCGWPRGTSRTMSAFLPQDAQGCQEGSAHWDLPMLEALLHSKSKSVPRNPIIP